MEEGGAREDVVVILMWRHDIDQNGRGGLQWQYAVFDSGCVGSDSAREGMQDESCE